MDMEWQPGTDTANTFLPCEHKRILSEIILPQVDENEINDFSVIINTDQHPDNINADVIKPQKTNILKIISYFLIIVIVSSFFIVIGKNYVRFLLLFMEKSDPYTSFGIFTLLFTLVSFPIAWGYVLLNIAAGYLYGLTMGCCIVAICAPIGILVAHLLIRKFYSEMVTSRLLNDNLLALIKIVESGQGFKIIILARLTPIPFGLQNAIFAVSSIKTLRYVIASILGLLPTQILNAYIGSTLRSMEEVISDTSQKSGYFIFAFQILATLLLLGYVIRKAKQEFNKVIEKDPDLISFSPKSSSPSPDSSQTSLLSVSETASKNQ